MTSTKLYDILGVTPNASKDEIKRAYKKLAIQYHPDKGGDPEKFKEISHAYGILSDDDKKRRYDMTGDDGSQGAQGFESVDPRHIFEQFFGGGFPFDIHGDFGHGPRHQVRRSDHVHVLKLSLADAYHGCQKIVRVGLQKTCFTCRDKCNACQGKGTITDMRRMGFFTQMMTRPCDVCRGTGMMTRTKSSCQECNGEGTYVEEKKIDIVVPKGVANGHQVRVQGSGEQAKDPSEISGDLVLQISIQEDPNFQRIGNDLIYKHTLTFSQSILGKRLTIPHFGGSIEVDTGSYGVVRPDKPYIIEQKGMPIADQKYGKLMIIFQVEYPTKHLSNEDRQRLCECFEAIGWSMEGCS